MTAAILNFDTNKVLQRLGVYSIEKLGPENMGFASTISAVGRLQPICPDTHMNGYPGTPDFGRFHSHSSSFRPPYWVIG